MVMDCRLLLFQQLRRRANRNSHVSCRVWAELERVGGASRQKNSVKLTLYSIVENID